MPTCLNCGDSVPQGADYCVNCAKMNIPSISTSTIKTQVTPQESPPNPSSTEDLSLRLEKAMRRTELLSYAAAGLALAILAVIITIAFL